MGHFELLMLAVSLSMDAFAVSVCKGLSLPMGRGRTIAKTALTAGAWFGGAQALMPIAGYALGSRFAGAAARWAHVLSFVLLAAIGLGMLRNSRSGELPDESGGMSPAEMLPLAAATSIDALAVGVMLAFLHANLLTSAAVIGAVTFAMSAAGTALGGLFGLRSRNGAEICGGITLIALGVKMLLGG